MLGVDRSSTDKLGPLASLGLSAPAVSANILGVAAPVKQPKLSTQGPTRVSQSLAHMVSLKVLVLGSDQRQYEDCNKLCTEDANSEILICGIRRGRGS